jgi:predicted AAA+ superfamily ATPase
MTEVMFRRKAYGALKEWKARSNGSTAMLVEGARMVGKTSLVTEFAKNEYESCIIVDFYRASNDVKKLFDDLSDLEGLFRGLQLYYDTELRERRSVIVFDEVQRFPRAREAIKALVQDGRYDYIETGSLISIKKNVKDIIIPSEEEKMELHPLDFEKFIWAKGVNTFRLLYPNYSNRKKVDDKVHHHMMKLFREYLAVGGMPQAVLKYVEGGSYQDVDRVKRDIIQLYLDDFRNMDPSGKLERLYLAIPSELSSQSTRYRITETIPNGRMNREGHRSIIWRTPRQSRYAST